MNKQDVLEFIDKYDKKLSKEYASRGVVNEEDFNTYTKLIQLAYLMEDNKDYKIEGGEL